jgi:hypothetical protein
VPSVRSDVFRFRGKRVGLFVINELKNHADVEIGRQLLRKSTSWMLSCSM